MGASRSIVPLAADEANTHSGRRVDGEVLARCRTPQILDPRHLQQRAHVATRLAIEQTARVS